MPPPPSEPQSAWARWKRATAFPYVWLGVYALWLLLSGSFLLRASIGWPLRAAGGGLAALLPPLLLWLSDWMERLYAGQAK